MQYFIAASIGFLVPIWLIFRWNTRVKALIEAAKMANERDDIEAFERHLQEAERISKRGPYRLKL